MQLLEFMERNFAKLTCFIIFYYGSIRFIWPEYGINYLPCILFYNCFIALQKCKNRLTLNLAEQMHRPKRFKSVQYFVPTDDFPLVCAFDVFNAKL